MEETVRNDAYRSGKISKNYKCEKCGAENCKLWMEYQIAYPITLCAFCAAKREKENIDNIDTDGRHSTDLGKTDRIGWYVPAVPTENLNGYCRYPSIPTPGYNWWRSLATLPETRAKN